jgi:hypothetical protein
VPRCKITNWTHPKVIGITPWHVLLFCLAVGALRFIAPAGVTIRRSQRAPTTPGPGLPVPTSPVLVTEGSVGFLCYGGVIGVAPHASYAPDAIFPTSLKTPRAPVKL